MGLRTGEDTVSFIYFTVGLFLRSSFDSVSWKLLTGRIMLTTVNSSLLEQFLKENSEISCCLREE